MWWRSNGERYPNWQIKANLVSSTTVTLCVTQRRASLSGTLQLFCHALYVTWDAHLDKSKNLHILKGGFSYLSHKLNGHSLWFSVCKTLSHSSKEFFILWRLKTITAYVENKMLLANQIEIKEQSSHFSKCTWQKCHMSMCCDRTIAAWRSEHFLAWVFYRAEAGEFVISYLLTATDNKNYFKVTGFKPAYSPVLD